MGRFSSFGRFVITPSVGPPHPRCFRLAFGSDEPPALRVPSGTLLPGGVTTPLLSHGDGDPTMTGPWLGLLRSGKKSPSRTLGGQRPRHPGLERCGAQVGMLQRHRRWFRAPARCRSETGAPLSRAICSSNDSRVSLRWQAYCRGASPGPSGTRSFGGVDWTTPSRTTQ